MRKMNYEIVRGADVTVPYYVRDAGNSAIDVTGWSIAFAAAGGVLTASLTPVTPSSGHGTFTFSAAQTGALPEGDVNFGVYRSDSGYKTPLTYGVLSVVAVPGLSS